MDKCGSTKWDGTPCKGTPIHATGWCVAHHPEYPSARKQGGAKGGRRAGRGRPLLDVMDAARQLQSRTDEVRAGQMDRASAAVCGQLLNYKVRALEGGPRRWRETEELARELRATRDA